MPKLDLEAEYDNRGRVANSAAIIARWSKSAAQARAELPVERDIAYGPGPRNVYDFYRADGGDAAPLAVYIHGGYWQRGHGHDYAFVARELVRRGVSVALPSYTLCPDAGIADIAAEMEQFVAALWVKTKRRPVITGHSAGGHLAAMLTAARFVSADAPADLVRAAYGLSGVYDLPPLLPTTLNGALRLDAATAWRLSPLFGPKPSHACTFVAAVGGDESSEFIRQSRELAAAWGGGLVTAECDVIEGANHFTIVDELSRAGSRVFERVVALAEAVA
jgi:arylformamidase